MISVKRSAGLAALGAVFVVVGMAGSASAQTPDMKLINGPVYGELRDVLGATLPVATPSPKCPKPLALPDGACLDRVVAGMKARGATVDRALTGRGVEGGA